MAEAAENKESSALETRLQQINSLHLHGYHFSDQKWLQLLIGSSNGLVLSFTPGEKDQEHAQDSSSNLQATVNSSLRAASSLGDKGTRAGFALDEVRLSIQGLGLDVPAVISTVCFRKSNVFDAAEEEHEEEEEPEEHHEHHHRWWITNAVTQLAQSTYKWTKGMVSGAFHLGQRSAFKIGSSMLTIEPELRAWGYALEEDWFRVTIGTYVGAELEFSPFEVEGERAVPSTSNMTFFQAAIVRTLQSVEVASAKLTGENFSVAKVTLRVTKLGLNIPEVSATILLRDNRASSENDEPHAIELHSYLNNKPATLEELEEDAHEKAEAAAAAQRAGDDQVEGQLAKAGRHLQELGAKHAENTLVATKNTLKLLNLRSNDPNWASVIVGTSNGSGITLRPIEKDGEARIEEAKERMREDNGGADLSRTQNLLLSAASYINSTRNSIKKAGFAVSTVGLNVDGLGLAIPRAFANIVLAQK